MTKSMKELSLHGKIIRWVSNTTHLFLKRLYNLFFLKNKIGVSFDNSVTLNKLTSALPPLHTFYNPATDLSPFEVIDIDIRDNTVTIRETGTDNEFDIDVELFIILFVRVEDDVAIDLQRYK